MSLPNITEAGARITDPFGKRAWRRSKSNPDGFHSGLDIAGVFPGNTPLVNAMSSGVVICTEPGTLPGRNGNYLGIVHDGDRSVGITVTLYGHMTNLRYKVGNRVAEAGSPVGKMGRHGLSSTTGVHLHFEVMWIPAPYVTNFLKDPGGFLRRNPVLAKSFLVDPYMWLTRYGAVFKDVKGADGKVWKRLQPAPVKSPPPVVKPPVVKPPVVSNPTPAPKEPEVTKDEVKKIIDQSIAEFEKRLRRDLFRTERYSGYYIDPETGEQKPETLTFVIQTMAGNLQALVEAAIDEERLNPQRVNELAPTREDN